jgi:arsenical pump membrane protein
VWDPRRSRDRATTGRGMAAPFAGALLVITAAMVLARPWNLSRAWWPALGGGVVVAAGLISPRQAADVLSEVVDPLALLVGMMALSAVAEKAGIFDWAASLAIRAGAGRVSRLFVFVFVIGCLVTAVFSLDTTAVVLTPIVYGAVSRLRLKPLPFMFACVYAANTGSLFLPVSNLTNLLAYEAFEPGFARFTLVMLLPATLAVLTNLLLFSWFFRRELRGHYDPGTPANVPTNAAFFRFMAGSILGILLCVLPVATTLGASIGTVVLVSSLVVAGVARFKGWIVFRKVVGSVSWEVLVLVAGLFVVVRAAEEAGLDELARDAYAAIASGNDLSQILAVTSIGALGSNVLGNLPTTFVTLDALRPLISEGALGPFAVYATVIGTSIGPNLTVVGSVATLIWLPIVRRKGVEVRAKDYLKLGAISTPPILLAAAIGLWVSAQLFAN